MITSKCNLRCEFCDVPERSFGTKMMQKEHAFRAIDSAIKIGVKQIELTGGEPLLHPDFFEIVDYLNSKNINPVLSTNGLLIKENLEKIVRRNFFCICVSVDGKEKTHDELRNRVGTYAQILEGMNALKQKGIDVAASFVVTRKNVRELEEVYEFFSAKKIRLLFFPVINMPDLFISNPSEVKLFLTLIKKMRRQKKLFQCEYRYLRDAISVYFKQRNANVRCLGLSSELGIDVDGNISPCCVWANRKAELNNLGNIATDNLEELWRSEKFHSARKSIFYEGCKNCFNPSICEFVRLTELSYNVTSRPNAVAPARRSDLPRRKEPLKIISNPSHVHFRLTSRCNLACRHCDMWKNPEKNDLHKELSLLQWIRLTDSLFDWLGPFRLDLAGGEILLYKGAIDLIEHCARKGIEVGLTTNATLIDLPTAQRLVNSGIFVLNISLDGLSDIHEYTRNRKGLYPKIESAVRYLLLSRQLEKPYVQLSTVITDYNLDDLLSIVGLIDKWGVNGVTFQALDHNFGASYRHNWFQTNEFWPKDYRKTSGVIDALINLKKKGKIIYNSPGQFNDMKQYYKNPQDILRKPCATGNKNLIIDEFGGMRLCWNLPPVANILVEDPRESWSGVLSQRRRDEVRKCQRTCRLLNCNYEQ